jgi:DNA primase
LESAVSVFEQERSELANQYLEARGINQDTARRFRLGSVESALPGHEQYMGMLSIPSLVVTHPVSVRFRALDPEQKPKYLGLPGITTRLFNLRAVYEAGEVIAITEGEIDAITLEQMGQSAVGVCGSNNWHKHHPRIFTGFRKVLIFGDGDEAGQKFANRVYESLTTDTVAIRVPLPQGEDVNSMFNTQREALEELIKEHSR